MAVLGFVGKQTESSCIEAVRESPEALQFIENQTSRVVIEAIKAHPESLEYVKDQCEDLCDLAYSLDKQTFFLAASPSVDLCLRAANDIGVEEVFTTLLKTRSGRLAAARIISNVHFALSTFIEGNEEILMEIENDPMTSEESRYRIQRARRGRGFDS
jgi:hypothetical protein